MEKRAWIPHTEDEYIQLGLKPGKPEKWEDGLRTTTKKGNYEWWYFDSKLEDGSSLVIVFYAGPIASFKEGFEPHATLNFTMPNGKTYKSRVDARMEDCSYSKEQCDIRIGECRFVGDMNQYEIYYKDDKIEATVTLKGNVPSWRPETGHITFNNEHYFAWLPSVPEGTVELTLKYDGKEKHLTGTGYHDHNWGDIPMFFLMHHWYWGRAKIGEYQVVTSFITASKKYGYDEIPIFMLAKNGEILADDAYNYLTYSELDYMIDPVTKKHVANRLIYDYDDGTLHYRITYVREADIEQMRMEAILTPVQQIAIWLIGLRGSYHRMTGTVTLERFEHGEVAETVTAPALWEQMYFGKDRIKGVSL